MSVPSEQLFTTISLSLGSGQFPLISFKYGWQWVSDLQLRQGAARTHPGGMAPPNSKIGGQCDNASEKARTTRHVSQNHGSFNKFGA